MHRWRAWARRLKNDALTVYLVYRDPRVPWYARWLAASVAAYAFSPIDLIPDAIPVLGYLDDLVVVPLGVALVLRMVPPQVVTDCRNRAATVAFNGKPKAWAGAAVVLLVWLLLAAIGARLAMRVLTHS